MLFFQSNKRKVVLLIGSVFLIFFMVMLSGCGKGKAQDNFLFITLDTQRADFISAYKAGFVSTPNIDSLAERGTLFENFYTLIPITLPSHASMFFSLPPHEIKNYNNGQIIGHKRRRPSFVSFFRRNGYTTAAFISLGVMTSKFGLNEGFDFYEDDFPKKRWYLTAEEINNKVFPWLEEHKKNKFFLWVHYSDPHDPYSPPDTPNDFKLFVNDRLILDSCLRKYEFQQVKIPLKEGKNQLRFEIQNRFIENPDHFLGKLGKIEFSPQQKPNDLDIEFSRGWLIKRKRNVFFFKDRSLIEIVNHKGPRTVSLSFRGSPVLNIEAVRTLYKEEVEYMDKEIGRLLEKLKKLGLSQKTKILVIGDHGEGLGEYTNFVGDPHFGHVKFLNDIYMKAPLIIYDPRNPQDARRIKNFVTTVDTAPTILKLMGLKGHSAFQGRDIFSLNKADDFAVFQETYKPEAAQNKFAILQYPWHLIFTPEERSYELFNMESDPEEKQDLMSSEGLPEDIKILKQKLDEFARNILKNKQEIKIDKKTEEMLRSLGYIK